MTTDDIDNNEMSKSFKNVFRERLASPVYGVFILTWMIIHWEFVYTAMFVNEGNILNETGLLKNEYLRSFLDLSSIEFYFLLGITLLVTWFLIWVVPELVLLPAFKISDDFEVSKMVIRLDNKNRILRKQLDISETIEKKTKAEKSIKVEEKAIKEIDPVVGWTKEFEQVIKDYQFLPAMKEAHKIIYQTSGQYTTNQISSSSFTTYIPAKQLSRLDVLGLVSLNGNKMTFTEKGKFFLRELQRRQVPMP